MTEEQKRLKRRKTSRRKSKDEIRLKRENRISDLKEKTQPDRNGENSEERFKMNRRKIGTKKIKNI